MKKIFVIILVTVFVALSQQTPLEKNSFGKLTAYDELTNFISQIDSISDLCAAEIIGKSVEGRNLYALKFSSSIFGKDKNKIRVLIFAQQHGNEQSGKEAALTLARDLLKSENKYLFDKIDFALVPQVNPDGSEKDQRRNANQMDLNRNHLILTEPEVIALHKLFDEYLFEATMDAHEYYPFTKDWMEFGYYKNFDVQVGATTNPNVSSALRNYSNEKYLPFIQNYLNEKNFSFHNYIPGGPPEKEYIRHSTFDINDGRQSLGILNSFSFIQEGINGKNNSLDNIKRRTESQTRGMRGLLEFVYLNKKFIGDLVHSERENILAAESKSIGVQMEHVKDGRKLMLNLFSISSEKDSMIVVENYRPIVKTNLDIEKPDGYLFPKNNELLLGWAERQRLSFFPADETKLKSVEEYFITSIDSIDFEGDLAANPNYETRDVTKSFSPSDYYFIPTRQLKGNMIVQALEPKSTIGVVQYKIFQELLREQTIFQIKRGFLIRD